MWLLEYFSSLSNIPVITIFLSGCFSFNTKTNKGLSLQFEWQYVWMLSMLQCITTVKMDSQITSLSMCQIVYWVLLPAMA